MSAKDGVHDVLRYAESQADLPQQLNAGYVFEADNQKIHWHRAESYLAASFNLARLLKAGFHICSLPIGCEY